MGKCLKHLEKVIKNVMLWVGVQTGSGLGLKDVAEVQLACLNCQAHIYLCHFWSLQSFGECHILCFLCILAIGFGYGTACHSPSCTPSRPYCTL